MKLADDALVAIMLCLQKGLCEGTDISDMLRAMELIPREDGKLGLDPTSGFMKSPVDVWDGD